MRQLKIVVHVELGLQLLAQVVMMDIMQPHHHVPLVEALLVQHVQMVQHVKLVKQDILSIPDKQISVVIHQKIAKHVYLPHQMNVQHVNNINLLIVKQKNVKIVHHHVQLVIMCKLV